MIGVVLKTLLFGVEGFSDMDVDIAVDRNLLRPTDTLKIEANINEIKKQVGWEPKHPIEDSLFEIHERCLSA